MLVQCVFQTVSPRALFRRRGSPNEHFNNNPEALPLWQRPLLFLKILGLVGGGAVLASLPFRGTLSRVAMATALLYAPFLAFIDHFSNHYFLPLLTVTCV